MCGIVGIVGQSPVNQRLYDAMTVLQHRGQDAAGIMTLREGELFVRKDAGLVRDVFQQRHMVQLAGNAGIGHVRYPTAGCDRADEAQPFYVNSPFGIGLGHNGNLTNTAQLTETLVREDRRHLNTSSDSEVLLNVLASELQKSGGGVLGPQDIFSALESVFRRCQGGFAVVTLVVGHGVIGFRDPNGIRPLVLGRRETPRGTEWMLASESVALDMLDFRLVRDVNPGEAVFIDLESRLHTHQCAASRRHTPCIFEYVYFARPDSIIDNISVHKARMRMGERLAEKVRRLRPDHDIDVVIPIPDTSRTSAMQMAAALGVKYREGFVKNRYIGRTFIMPGQEMRRKSVRGKLNAIDLEFRGRNVLLVDDSIVRGTTSAQIIEMAREAGAAKERLWHRQAGGFGAGRCGAGRGRGRPNDRRRLAHLPGPGRPRLGMPARQRTHRGVRRVVLLGRVRHRRCHSRLSGQAHPRARRRREGAASRRSPDLARGARPLTRCPPWPQAGIRDATSCSPCSRPGWLRSTAGCECARRSPGGTT